MKAKLRKLLAQGRRGLLVKSYPNPFADYLGKVEQVGIDGMEQGQQLVRGQETVCLPGFRVNGQAAVRFGYRSGGGEMCGLVRSS